ncbi:MAG: MFS transporter [Gammaproteobacteria bacterium]|nr:MFS transporter [Gammaproteobacteria bacterium]
MNDKLATTAEDSQDFDVNNIGTLISVVTGSGVALLALFMGPLLVGEYIAKLAVSESQAGLLMSAEMAGFTLGSAVFFIIARLNWRKIVTSALLIIIVGNTSLLLVDSLPLFVLCRFVAGLGSGMVMTMTIQVIGLMRDPDRVYGMWSVGQLSFGALGIVFFPIVVASNGIDFVFLIWGVLTAILGLTVRFYPDGRALLKSSGSNSGMSRHHFLGLLCLLGLFIYYSGQTGVWFYMERVGLNWGIDREAVGNTLFIGLLAAIAGSATAVLLGDKAGRAIPLSISMLISALSIILLISLNGEILFTLTVCLFNFGWYLFMPYMSAIVASIDGDGKLLTGLAVTFPAALTAGPAIAALLIGNADTLLPCLIFGLVSVPLGLLLILPAARIVSIKN